MSDDDFTINPGEACLGAKMIIITICAPPAPAWHVPVAKTRVSTAICRRVLSRRSGDIRQTFRY